MYDYGGDFSLYSASGKRLRQLTQSGLVTLSILLQEHANEVFDNNDPDSKATIRRGDEIVIAFDRDVKFRDIKEAINKYEGFDVY